MNEIRKWIEYEDQDLVGTFFIPLSSFLGIGYTEDDIRLLISGQEVVIFETIYLDIPKHQIREIIVEVAKNIDIYSVSDERSPIDLNFEIRKLLEFKGYNISQEDNIHGN